MGTVILYCGCKASAAAIAVKTGQKVRQFFTKLPVIREAGALFQDRRYGTGMRVHNIQKTKDKSDKRARCTVCGESRGY